MAETVPQSPMAPRVVRVFVSSTFSDMHAERDELSRRVFPKLRKLCEDRGITWTDVDLRWGITDEQVDEGKVLPICLAEVNNCRPFFIGLLGERYGWVPRADEISAGLIADQPWLAEHMDHSVTELEILHGVLNDPAMAKRTFFYFRDPRYIDTIPQDKKADYVSESPEAAGKLTELKGRIRKSALPLEEPYPNPQSLADLVLEHLTDAIDQEFPPGTEPDPLDADAAEHEAFAVSRARVYIGRDEYFARLDSQAGGDGKPLVVLGESGSGKSALLANWALQYRRDHEGQPLLMHFIGASAYSADWAAMLRRIMGELKRLFDIDGEIPTNPDDLRAEFANWLHMASARGRVVLILDALNQLEDKDQAPDLVWLPPVIPANVRLIVSTLPGRANDALANRDWPEMKVEPLTADERRQFIAEYLGTYTRSLNDARTNRITSAPQSANPLYLQTLLDELRVVGKYENLGNQIYDYLTAETVPQLYQKVLARYETDYDRDRPDLVRDVMTLLWAARRGLSEPELLYLLGREGEPMPHAHWSPLRFAADRSLVIRSGLINFSHDYLRQAVQNRYLPTDTDRHKAHTRLADYFEPRELNDRKVDELPWQLAQSESWQRLYDLLADLLFLEMAWQINEFEIKAYWAKVEQSCELRMVNAYRSVVNSPEEHQSFVWYVARLLADTGHPTEAMSLREYLEEYYRRSGDQNKLQGVLGSKALILQDLGDLDGAMALLKEQERICCELGKSDGFVRSMVNQAVILQVRGDLDGAMVRYKEFESLCRELSNKTGLQISLGNQATILHARGDLDGAMTLLKEVESLSREEGNPDSLQRSLGNQALILRDIGDLDGAMALHKEAERLCRELGDKASLQISLGNQAMILSDRDDIDGAMALHKESERLCRELGDKAGLKRSLGSQTMILSVRGEIESAMALHKEFERLCRELGDKASLQISLSSQAGMLSDCGDLDGAMALYKELERIFRELSNKTGLEECLGSQGDILYARGELNGAMAMYKEKERICRELGNPDGLQRSLGNQASILRARGDIDGALALCKETEGICRELGNKSSLQISLGNQANILSDRGDLDGAMTLHKEKEQICRELGNKSSLGISLGNQALILYSQGDFYGAMTLHKEHKGICLELGNKDSLGTPLASQATLLAKMGHATEGLSTEEVAKSIAGKHGFVSQGKQFKPLLPGIRQELHVGTLSAGSSRESVQATIAKSQARSRGGQTQGVRRHRDTQGSSETSGFRALSQHASKTRRDEDSEPSTLKKIVLWGIVLFVFALILAFTILILNHVGNNL